VKRRRQVLVTIITAAYHGLGNRLLFFCWLTLENTHNDVPSPVHEKEVWFSFRDATAVFRPFNRPETLLEGFGIIGETRLKKISIRPRHQYRVCYDIDAGWSSPVAREAHNLEVVGSNPAPATE
jgi:hypothetical protein